MNCEELENVLLSKIPICRHMKIKILQADKKQISIEGDLEANHNHLGTAFGGSLSSLMILAGYCQVFQLIEGKGHVLLKSSTMNFRRPVEQNIVAVSHPPSEQDLQQFVKVYDKWGKSRISVNSHILLENGEIACTMNSEFVGIR